MSPYQQNRTKVNTENINVYGINKDGSRKEFYDTIGQVLTFSDGERVVVIKWPKAWGIIEPVPQRVQQGGQQQQYVQPTLQQAPPQQAAPVVVPQGEIPF